MLCGSVLYLIISKFNLCQKHNFVFIVPILMSFFSCMFHNMKISKIKFMRMDENFVGVNLIFVAVRWQNEHVRLFTKCTKNSNLYLNETDSFLEKSKFDKLVMKQRSIKCAWHNSNSCLNGSIKNLLALARRRMS